MMHIYNLMLALAILCLSASLVSAQFEGWWMIIVDTEHCRTTNFDFSNVQITDKNITWTQHNSTTIHLQCHVATGGLYEGKYYGVQDAAYRTCYNNTNIFRWYVQDAECKECGFFCNGCNLWGADAECDNCPPNAKDDNDTTTSSVCECETGYFNKWDYGVWTDMCRPLSYFCNLYADPWMLKNEKHPSLTVDVNYNDNPAQAGFSCAGDVGLSASNVRTCIVHNNGWWFDWDDMSTCVQCGWGCTDCDSIHEACNVCFANAHDNGMGTSTCICDPGWQQLSEKNGNDEWIDSCVRSYCSFTLTNGDLNPVRVNSLVDYSYFPDGTTSVEFNCDTGYFNNGASSMTCNAVQGDGGTIEGSAFSEPDDIPTCVKCGDLCKQCDGGKNKECGECSINSVDDGDKTATCRCFDGYRQKDNEFECVKAQCQQARLENGQTTPADGEALTFETMQFSCDVGYELTHSNTLTCNPDVLSDSSSWDIDRPECINIDECVTIGDKVNGDCMHTCTDAPLGSYTCSCEKGWNLMTDGISCEECDYKCDECTNGPGNACTKCVDRYGPTTNRSSCECGVGWVLESGFRTECIDVNECLNNNGMCEHTCINTPGSYECDCDATYSLKDDSLTCRKCGYKCEGCLGGDNAPCSTCAVNSLDDGTNTNSCACTIGWQDDENNVMACRDTNECLINNGSCEIKCVNIPGSYRCTCNLGDLLANNDNDHYTTWWENKQLAIFEALSKNDKIAYFANVPAEDVTAYRNGLSQADKDDFDAKEDEEKGAYFPAPWNGKNTNCTLDEAHMLEDYRSAGMKSVFSLWTAFALIFISYVAKLF